MTAFRYHAVDNVGRKSTGVLEADTSKAARGLLRERGLFPLEVASVSQSGNDGKASRRKLKPAELTLLTRQWATLLASGLTVEQALAALIEQAETEASRQLLAGVRSEILTGYSLRAALDRYPQAFTPLYRASVAAGEKSGELARVMNQLADYLDRNQALRAKTLQALLYPAIVMSVALLVIVGLMTYVVPQVVSVFQQSKQTLPLLTRSMIVLSGILREWGWVMALTLVGALFAGRRALRDTAVKRRWDAWLLSLPLLGRHLRTLDATRFASTLSILAGSGVALLAALDAGRQVIARLPLADAVTVAAERVREGQSLSRALGASRQFPPLLIHMIANGEATGRVDELLERAARLQQAELENRTATLTALLEPLLLLLMGGFVLLIVLAVMQPIIEINTLMK
ncbi:MAG TPA: type II secretion system inner membrane protein GspF [Piscinibacter sp.]|nr:type II secretion system inner membrane protein GspF [Piscinibacter sp.]HNM82347.1 type II secretion system inner membrane protein GspF [Rhodocyclaceae bacterium]